MTTGREVFIINREKDLIHVKYVNSKHTSWFDVKDFVRIFTKA